MLTSKKDPRPVAAGRGSETQKGNSLMTTLVETAVTHTTPALTIGRGRDALEAINAEVAETLRRREQLINETQEALDDAGWSTLTVEQSPYGRKEFDLGTEFFIIRRYWSRRGSTEVSHSIVHSSVGTAHRHPGPYYYGEGEIYVDMGAWNLIVADDDRMLFARCEPDWFGDADHQKCASRLRNLARHDDLRVRVRDRHVRLVDPLENEIYSGDLFGAFAFLCNIDIKENV